MKETTIKKYIELAEKNLSGEEFSHVKRFLEGELTDCVEWINTDGTIGWMSFDDISFCFGGE